MPKKKSQSETTTIKLSNVFPVYRNDEIAKYQTSMSAGQLADFFNDNIIYYDGEVQRGNRKNKKGQEVAIFSLKNVKEIYQAMAENTLHGGALTLNLRKEDSNFEYNEENQELTFNGRMQILDGQHRIRACILALKEHKRGRAIFNPFLYEFSIIIEHLSQDEAKSLFSEYAMKPKKISRTRSAFLNVGDINNTITRKLIKDSELKGKVECVKNVVRGKNIVTFAVLSSGIANFFKPKTKEEGEKIAEWLTLFYDKLVNMFPNAMGNVDDETRDKMRKETFLLEQLFMNAYIAIASELQFDPDWREKINKLKEPIQINGWEGYIYKRNCPLWNKILRDGKIVNSNTTQKIVVENLVNYVLDKPIEQVG